MRISKLIGPSVGLIWLAIVACGSNNPVPTLPRADDGGVTETGWLDARPAPAVDGGTFPPGTIRRPDVTVWLPPVQVTDGDAGRSVDATDNGLPPPLDTDGDTISDADEGSGEIDTDADGVADYLDLDSDNDGLSDRIEAHDADPFTPPPDSDGDGDADFRDLDSDDDGIDDRIEGTLDPDGDSKPAFIDRDSDGDLIDDAVEGNVDTDNDTQPDFLDLDSDGDSLGDVDEGHSDFDGDGKGNWRDIDSDDDGILDREEGLRDPDGDGQPAFIDLDADGDLLTDSVEGTADPDNDGDGNWVDIDSDNDTIRDLDEQRRDPDGDLVPAYLDPDSDDDGLLDRVEAGDADLATPPDDPDGDGLPSYIDIDSDNDTILDATEGAADQDGDGRPSFIDPDADGDGISDAIEAGDDVLSTRPIDTDGDGLADYADIDSDGDSIHDAQEGLTDVDMDTVPDYRDRDSDNDGRTDAAEAGDASLSTPAIDTDGDGAEDFRDVDSDNDGFGDAAETGCPGSTHHLIADSDGDGLVDPIEVAVRTDPCDALSIVDGLFFVLGALGQTQTATLPFDRTEIDRADLALNVDTTGSMRGEIGTLQSSLTSLIIPGLQSVVSEAGFAVSSFEDYPVDPFGASDVQDRPFRLLTRVTTDAAAAQTAVSQLTIRNGRDLPESGLESLYQLATGDGTAWGPAANQRVPSFNPAIGLLPGVADGTIGGVGFRSGALPIVVHVTDTTSHFATTYQGVSAAITAAPTASVRSALAGIGARVISVVSEPLPRPVPASLTDQMFADSCQRRSAQFFGRIDSPRATDIDWYQLTGAAAGNVVTAEVTAERIGSTLDSVVAIYDSAGRQLALNDNLQGGLTVDSRAQVTLSGLAPFYVAVSSYNDLNFDGTGAVTSGYYFLNVAVNGVGFTPADPTCPGTDLGTVRTSATELSALSTVLPAPAGCEASCSAEIADEPLALPYGISQSTGAAVPPCAWDAFGLRPANCGPAQCCTGPQGYGQTPNAAGRCPLAFEVDSEGVGLDQAIVTGLQALVRFSTFDITTVVRADPTALTNQGLDTRCFIHQIVPTVATTPNACAPAPVTVADGWTNVVPGTQLTFRIDAQNRVAGTGQACIASQHQPVAFLAYIDVVADGVTVLDTQVVTIVVPGQPTATGL